MTHTDSAVAEWRGRTAVDSDGDKIGSIDEIYADADTGKPEWLAVKTGMFGSKVSFIPITEARDADGDMRLPYDRQQVKDAPNAEAEKRAFPKERVRLDKETVTEDKTVSEEVRKEQIEAEGDTADSGGRRN